MVALADSWACTNPSVGRGISIGTMHAVGLRDLLHDMPSDPVALQQQWHDVTMTTVEPWYRATLAFDEARLAEVDALLDGREFEPTPEFEMTKAAQVAAGKDPECLRALLEIVGALTLPEEVFARPGVFERVIELGSGWRDEQLPGPEPRRARRHGRVMTRHRREEGHAMKVDSSGVQLDVQVEGDRRPVVLLHGFPDSKRLWANQVPALVDAGFQVIVPDQRGYGASDKPAEVDAYSIPFLAIDVTAILDALSIEKAHVVGHDWGAAVAWATASFAPERVDHLAALSVGHMSSFGERGPGAAREVLVHAAVPVPRCRRAVAVRRRLGGPARMVAASRCRRRRRRPRPRRFPHLRAQLVPRQHHPRGVRRPTAWSSRPSRRRPWACGAAATSPSPRSR